MITSLFKRLLRSDSFENYLAEEARKRNGQPLLKALLDDKVQWGPGTFICRSKGGRFQVENDVFGFYFYVDGKSIGNLVDRVTANRIECAAVNQAQVGNAISDNEVLEKYL